MQGSLKDFHDDDIAAIVKGKEITIGDLRFLYADDEVLGNIEGTAKLDLMIQEAKALSVDISDEISLQAETMLALPLKDIKDPYGKSMREFIDSQAQKLGIDPEKYYLKYVEIKSEQNAYLNAYTHEKFGEPIDYNEEDLEKYNENANDFLNELVKKHKDEIEILIKQQGTAR